MRVAHFTSLSQFNPRLCLLHETPSGKVSAFPLTSEVVDQLDYTFQRLPHVYEVNEVNNVIGSQKSNIATILSEGFYQKV